MNILDKTNDDVILIAESHIKQLLLKNNYKLRKINCLSKQDLKKKIMFDYDERAKLYLINKYNLKVEVALMYLENIYYVSNEDYDSPKLHFLKTIKQELLDNNLLIKDNLFLDSIKGKKIIVYGYGYIDKYFKSLLDIVSNYAAIEIENNNATNIKDIKAYAFKDIEEEITFVAYSICDLIEKGTNINKIKISNITDDYLIPITRIFNFYNIPININNKVSLYSTNICLTFISLFKNNHNLKNSLNELKEMFTLEGPNLDIYNKLIDVCNDYVSFNENEILDLLIYKLKNTIIHKNKIFNAVDLIDLKNIILDDEIVFILSFNQGIIPAIHKNEDYITDDIAPLLNIETAYEKNSAEKELCLNNIKKLKNVIITYKLKSKSTIYYPSSLINDLDLKVTSNPKLDLDISYSSIQDKLVLSKKLDNLIKYNELDSDVDILYANYSDISYRTYDNSYKGINNEKMIDHIGSKLFLSYSSIDDYFNCAFKYYVNNIMKFKDREEAFHLTIGNLFHYCLSEAFKDDFDFDDTWDGYLKDITLTNKEQFFLEKLRTELKFIIKTIEEYNSLSTLDKALYEEKIYVNFKNKIDVTFSGIVDKILYKDDDKTLVSIVDYKTGTADININNVMYGLNMQLPIYLYLVKNSNKFKDPTFVGFYLQEILHNEIYRDNKKAYEDKKRDNLKLKGYTINDTDIISKFDSSYVDSRVIKGMKISSKGFYAYSKVIDEKDINNLVDEVTSKINEAATDILTSKFDINPKRLGNINVACRYCDFKDLCYMKEKDIVTLKEIKDTSFLGGDADE